MAENGAAGVQGQTAVVTAAAAGIGRATALGLAKAGVGRLHLVDRDEAGLAETEALIGWSETMVQVSCWTGNGTDAADVERIAADILATGAPHIMVNGIGGGAREKSSLFLESEPATWRSTIDLTVLSGMLFARALVPAMVTAGYGRVVTVSSDVANFPTVGMTDYGAAKTGVLGFTRGLAIELATSGVTVNAVAPGPIATAAVASLPEAVLAPIMASVPMGRLGEPEEVAATILFLAGREASFITGQTVAVNGGRTMA
jgi:NAD(P)-dependent dehydrogenase (short-subunit alcohol dehydrogenase family)